MPVLKVKRVKELTNALRDYKIFVDGKNIGQLGNGQTKKFDITSGSHKVMAKIDWCSSQTLTFEINHDETKYISVRSATSIRPALLLSLGILALHVLLNSYLNFSYFQYLMLPVALSVIYNLTFQRKKYLAITSSTLS